MVINNSTIVALSRIGHSFVEKWTHSSIKQWEPTSQGEHNYGRKDPAFRTAISDLNGSPSGTTTTNSTVHRLAFRHRFQEGRWGCSFKTPGTATTICMESFPSLDSEMMASFNRHVLFGKPLIGVLVFSSNFNLHFVSNDERKWRLAMYYYIRSLRWWSQRRWVYDKTRIQRSSHLCSLGIWKKV